ncbi:MAG: putative toxin-antitoxin system toxin component, PIN family [Candidatus Omnitrophica bacterium]|nr:putative toxin-antitoxin system toxin component, PIN family [Candidatus Omnitrophota bacterium]
MKILFDTSVLVSAFTIRGQTFDVLKDVVYKHDAYYTDYILLEFRQALEKNFPQLSPRVKELDAFVIERYFFRGLSAKEIKPVSRDPNDDQILADALANHIDIILTGDKDLLVLKIYEGVRILAPKDYWTL